MMQAVVARDCSCGEVAELLMGMRVAEGLVVVGVLGDRRSGRLWRLVPSPTRSARAWYRQVRRCCRKRRFAAATLLGLALAYSATPSFIWAQSMLSVPLSLKTSPLKRMRLPGAMGSLLSSCVLLSA